MPDRRHLLPAAVAAAFLLVASGASADTINTFTAGATPSHIKPSTSSAYTFVLTNDAASPEGADRAKIGIPPGFVVDLPTMQATTSAAGACQASTWVPDGVLLADAKLEPQASGDQPERRAVRRRNADGGLHGYVGGRGDGGLGERASSRRSSLRPGRFSADLAGGRHGAPGLDHVGPERAQQRHFPELRVQRRRAGAVSVQARRRRVRELRLTPHLRRTRRGPAHVLGQGDRLRRQPEPYGRVHLDDRHDSPDDRAQGQAE